MEKIEFKDLPDTTTPFTASLFNELQDNIENAIDEIIDEGTDENGTYIKYKSGKMICYAYVQTGTRDYPQQFIENPLIVVTPVYSNDSTMHISQATTTTTQITINSFWANISNSLWQQDLNINVNYLAIGKWK